MAHNRVSLFSSINNVDNRLSQLYYDFQIWFAVLFFLVNDYPKMSVLIIKVSDPRPSRQSSKAKAGLPTKLNSNLNTLSL